jgi:multiple sugar transport system substrate-binding protein
MYKSTDNMMIQLLRQKNAGYSTEDGQILILNDTTRELLNTLAEHVQI